MSTENLAGGAIIFDCKEFREAQYAVGMDIALGKYSPDGAIDALKNLADRFKPKRI